MISLPAELDRNNVVDVDLGSAEFKANAHRDMAEWARRRPFYVLGNGPPQVVVGRYADVHRVFSETAIFKSEMPRGPGWEQFNKIMFAQFVTQMDGEQHARFADIFISVILHLNGTVSRFTQSTRRSRLKQAAQATGPCPAGGY